MNRVVSNAFSMYENFRTFPTLCCLSVFVYCMKAKAVAFVNASCIRTKRVSFLSKRLSLEQRIFKCAMQTNICRSQSRSCLLLVSHALNNISVVCDGIPRNRLLLFAITVTTTTITTITTTTTIKTHAPNAVNTQNIYFSSHKELFIVQ